MQKIAVLISGSGSNLQALIDYPQADYQIALVLSNRPDAYGLQRAQQAGIATEVIDHTLFDSREAFDQQMQACLANYQIDWVILAGFMRILTKDFTQHYLGKMLNIHPSLLPKYRGLHTHQQALEAGDTHHGVSIHFVTPELDGGPVILQAKVAISTQDTVTTLQNKVHQQEHLIYPPVVNALVQGTLRWQNQQAYFLNQPLNAPLTLEQLKQPEQ